MTTSRDNFDQSRKASAEPCSPQVREHLSDWYGVDKSHIIYVESIKDGKYDAGVNDLVDRLDYKGIDWLVPRDGILIPVGQRLLKASRGNWRYMTLRSDNGTENPSEVPTIPKAIDQGGIYPADYYLGIREQWDVHRAILFDTAELVRAGASSRVKAGVKINDEDDTEDDTECLWMKTADLLNAGCEKEVWIDE
jgi:hypothetical protein